MAGVENENENPIRPQGSDPDEGVDVDEPVNVSYNGVCRMLFPSDPNFEEKWAQIWTVMKLVLADKPITRAAWTDVFIHVYQLCNAVDTKTATEFYDRVHKAVEAHIDDIHVTLARLSDKNFFNEFHVQCVKIEKVAEYLDRLFSHLNQHIQHNAREMHLSALIHDSVSNNRPLIPIDETVNVLWRERILNTSVHRVASIVLDQFDNHRQGKPIENPEKLRRVIEYFVAADKEKIGKVIPFEVRLHPRREKLNLYHSGIEDRLKESCFRYNNQKFQEWSNITNKIQYINNVAELMESEKNFANLIMHPSTSNAIETWISEILVKDKVVDSKLTFRDQMTREFFDEICLKRSFSVLKLIPNRVDNLCHDFSVYIAEILAENIESSANDPKVFVAECSRLSKQFYGIVERVFYGHKSFASAVEKAIRHTVNFSLPGQIKPGDKVTRFADQCLWKQPTPDEDILFENFATVLKFIDNREQFEKTYQVLLANRLLAHVTTSTQREMFVIEKTRGICTGEFVQRCNRMCMDIEHSVIENAEFKKKNEQNFSKLSFREAKQAPIDITILQTGSWPLQIGKEEYGPAMPMYFVKTLQCFTNYYTKAHCGRQLSWAPSLSTVDVRLTYLDRPYTITMTAIHYDILVCFEDVDVYSINDLGIKAKLVPDFLKRYSKPLVEYGILKLSKPDDWSPLTLISLNPTFSRKNNKLRLPIPMTNRALKQDIRPEVTGNESDANRQYLDSIIVRELKQHKLIKHTELFADVLKIVNERFPMTTQVFKKSVESLIERGYVKRGITIGEYHYVA